MKQLDLQQSIETFLFFDILAIIIAGFGFILGAIGFFLGGYWLYLAWAMIFGEILLIYGTFLAPHRLKVKRYRESIGNSPTVWIKIVLVSDLHLHDGKNHNWVHKIAAKVMEQKPDLFLIGGDIVVHDAKDALGAEPLSQITATYGSYYVLGNHDYQDDPAMISKKLSSLGINNLCNTSLSFNVQGKELCLSGLDDGFYGMPSLPIKRGNKSSAHITLVHEPDMVLDIAEGESDLVLAGHSHGGQVRLPVIGSLKIPSALGRKADGGRKIIKGMPTIISRGLGEVGSRARLFAPPEIVVIELGI